MAAMAALSWPAQVDLCANLLEARPEQEAALLSMCVNKLGDKDRKVASRATYRLQLLLQAHSAMVHTVVKYVTGK
jgi:ribosome biogenesis protein MAK21